MNPVATSDEYWLLSEPRPRGRGIASMEAQPIDVPGLTGRMRDGDDRAFTTFHGLYFDRMFRYAFVLCRCDEDAAKDVSQEALIRVVRYIKPMRDGDVLWSWLTVLIRSAAADRGRKESRFRKLLERFRLSAELTRAVSGEASPHEGLVPSAMACLTPEERQLVEKKYFSRASYRSLAAELNTTERAIEGRLARAREKLRDAILTGARQDKTEHS